MCSQTSWSKGFVDLKTGVDEGLCEEYFKVYLLFHTVHGVLVERKLEWFAIPSSSGPRFIRTLHCDLFIFSGPA